MLTFQKSIQSVGKTLTIVHVQNTTRNQNVLPVPGKVILELPIIFRD
jgi:hypothetical protein